MMTPFEGDTILDRLVDETNQWIDEHPVHFWMLTLAFLIYCA